MKRTPPVKLTGGGREPKDRPVVEGVESADGSTLVPKFSANGKMPANHGFLDTNRGAAEARWRRQQEIKREKAWEQLYGTPEQQQQQQQAPSEEERTAAWAAYYAAQAQQAAAAATDPAEAERQKAWAAYYSAQSAQAGSSKRARDDDDPGGAKAQKKALDALFAAMDGGNGSPAAVKAVLMQGVLDVDAIGPGGMTALQLAAKTNKPALVQAMLDADADPDILNAEGFSALHYACIEGSKKMVEALLGAGANPVLKTAAGDAPIMLVDPALKMVRILIGNAAGKRHAH